MTDADVKHRRIFPTSSQGASECEREVLGCAAARTAVRNSRPATSIDSRKRKLQDAADGSAEGQIWVVNREYAI